MGSKIIKIGLYVLLFIFLLIGGCILAIRTPFVQKKVIDKITSELSDQLGTEVSIERVGISFPDYAVLEGVKILDYHGDSVLYLEKIKLALHEYDSEKRLITFSKVEMEEPRVYFHRPQDAESFNYVELIKKMQSGASSGGGGVWTLDLGNVKIKNGTFVFFDENREEPTGRKFKDNHINLSQINLDADHFEIIDDSLHFDLAHLSALDHSGLELKEMRAVVNIHKEGIEFGQLHLETPHSLLTDTFSMRTENYLSYAHFFDQVYLYTHLEKSVVGGKDLALFSDEMAQYADNVVQLDGVSKGYLKKLKLRDMLIGYENSTVLTSGKIWGLPNWDDTYIDLEFDDITTNADDLNKLGVAGKLPDFFDEAGTLQYKGRFQGFQNDFVAYGSVVSDVGLLNTDLNFKIKEGRTATYSGAISGNRFNVGRLFNMQDVGVASFSFKLKEGTGLNLNEFRTKFEGNISSVQYQGYEYQNTSVKGGFDQKKFDGTVLVNDPNLVMDFKGEVDYNQKSPQYNVRAKLDKANLEALGIDTSIQDISGVATAQFTGSGIIDFNGELDIHSVEIIREDVTIPLKNLSIRSETVDTTQRMVLNSDFIDVKLEGVYDLKEWNSAYKVFIHDLFPDYYPLPEVRPKETTYKMELRFKNHPFLGAITGEQYQFGVGTLKGDYSSTEQSLRVDGNLSHMAYGPYRFDDWSFNIIKEPHQLLNLSMDIAKLKEDGDEVTHDIIFDAHILPNDAEFLFNFAYPDDEVALNSYGELKFSSDTIEAYFMESILYIQGVKWALSNENRVLYHNDEIDVSRLSFSNETSKLKIDGKINGEEDEKLMVELTNFDLDNISPFVSGSTFGGKAFGTLDLFRIASDDPFFHGDVLVEDLVYNDNYLGKLKMISNAKNDPLLMEVYAEMQSGMIKDLEVVGNLDLHKNKRTMDLAIRMADVDATPLQEIFTGLASNFDGKVSADLTAKGKFAEPKINGEIELSNMGMTVDYLQARYVTNGSIGLSENKMTMKGISLEDEQGQTGLLTGMIAHRYFDDFKFDLKFKDLNNFLVLNTTKTDNELFYGKAFVDGSMDVKGPLNDIYLDIIAKTRAGTNMFIPLVYEAGTSNVSYINFVDFKDTTQKLKQQQKIEGLSMNLTLDITPDAKTELIFDEFVNDKITGRGEGRIKMEISSSGEFDMYGDYIIESGDYPVSAFNTTPTRFILKKGGRIRWDGDPYEATIDLEATILESVNPNTLLATTEDELNQSANENIDVECQLFLKGSLFTPDITFDLNVPNNGGTQAPTRFNAVLNSIKADPDERNRQVFAIIVFGTFIPPTFADVSASSTAGNELVNTFRNGVSGMISNQVSDWISKYDRSLELSVDWEEGGENERRQIILEARKTFWKDLVEVQGSVDVGQNDGSNPYEIATIVKVSDRVRVKAFTKLVNDPTLGSSNTVTTSGLGFFYRKRFNKFSELFGGNNKSKVKDSSVKVDGQ